MADNENNKGVVLLIDDEVDLLESCVRILEDSDFECASTSDSSCAIDIARDIKPSVVVTDFKMPGKNGNDLLNEFSEEFPDVPVIMVSAYASVEEVVKTVKMGAFDYLTKPFSSDQLVVTVKRAMERYSLKMENLSLRAEFGSDFFNHFFVGKHPKFLEIVGLIKKVANSKSSILLHGETGTGKELAARAIHASGNRADKPFVCIDCIALRDEDFDGQSMLASANSGFLYLENIDELSLASQGKIFNMLQGNLTGKNETSFDVRLTSSSTVDLHGAMMEKKFRENLYYLINVVNIHIPPLRERKEDIGILCDIFLKKIAEEKGSALKGIHHETLERLMEYNWPGNVRELRGAMEAASSVADSDTIMVENIPEDIRLSSSMGGLAFKEVKQQWMEKFERQYLENLLLSTHGNISKASEEAGIARMSLYRMIKRNNLTKLAAYERGCGGGKEKKI